MSDRTVHFLGNCKIFILKLNVELIIAEFIALPIKIYTYSSFCCVAACCVAVGTRPGIAATLPRCWWIIPKNNLKIK